MRNEAVVAVLRCRGCAAHSYSAVAVRRSELVGPCVECGGEREVVELIADRRSGEDRRVTAQHAHHPDRRGGRDRRQAQQELAT